MKSAFFAVAFLLGVSNLAYAAGFDCAKARTAREGAVCADPQLGALDAEMARRYDAAMKSLSPEGGRALRAGQLEWLRFVDDLVDGKWEKTPYAPSLRSRYEARNAQLKDAVRKIGPYVFERVDHFAVADTADDHRPVETQVADPRIDAPDTEAVRTWNRLVAEKPGRDADDNCDDTVDFTLASATPKLISYRREDEMYCHGGAHPFGGGKGINIIMVPAVRPMTVTDLFGQAQGWRRYLSDRAYAVLHKKAAGEIDRQAVVKVATDANNWTLRGDALRITVNEYDVLSYADGETEIDIPWRDLKPYLAPDAPVPHP